MHIQQNMHSVNQIKDAFSQGKYTLGIFINLSQAFDTVKYIFLLEKLKAYRVQSENLKWFTSYLSNRKQFISYNDSKTEMKIVKCGVPQGCVLGPLPFPILSTTSTTRLKFFLILCFLRTIQIYFVPTII